MLIVRADPQDAAEAGGVHEPHREVVVRSRGGVEGEGPTRAVRRAAGPGIARSGQQVRPSGAGVVGAVAILDQRVGMLDRDAGVGAGGEAVLEGAAVELADGGDRGAGRGDRGL